MREELRTAFSPRQYMLSKDFEIYYYSDIHMKATGNHTHDYYEFYFFVDGDVSMIIADKEYVLSPGDLVLIPPHVPHYAVIHNTEIYYQRFVFWISKDYCNQLLRLSSAYGYIMQQAAVNKNYVHHFDRIAFNAIQSKIFNLIQEIHQDRYGKAAKVQNYVSDLVLDLNRATYEATHPIEFKESASLYQNLITYINAHLTDDISLDSLAEHFFLSKYHISHVFKANLGISIKQYIIKQRLNLFKDYMRQNGEIGKAYLQCGFANYSSFYRDFKNEFGISPNEYKRQVEKENMELLNTDKQ